MAMHCVRVENLAKQSPLYTREGRVAKGIK